MDNKLEIYLAAKDISGKGFASIEAKVADLSKSVLSLNGVMAGLTGAAGLGLVVQQTAEATAEMQKNATIAGVSAEAYQELSYASGQYKISQDALTDGLKELNLRAEEFAITGKGPGAESFVRLGYSAKDLNSRLQDTPGLLLDVIHRMEGMGTAAKMRIADEIFGGQGGEQFVAMINGGSTALAKLTDEAKSLGLVMDNSMVKDVTRADQAMSKLTMQIKTGVVSVMGALSPQLEDVAEWMGEWIRENQEFINQDIPHFFDNTAESIERISKRAKEGIENVKKFGNALGQILNYKSPIHVSKWLPGFTGGETDSKAIRDAVERYNMSLPDTPGGQRSQVFDINSKTQGYLDYQLSDLAGGSSQWPRENINPSPGQNKKNDYLSTMPSGGGVSYLYQHEDEINQMRLDAVKDFDEEYRQATMSKFDFERDQLTSSYANYQNYVTDKKRLNEWFSAESTRIDQEETAATKKTTDDMADTFKTIENAATDVFSSMEDQWVSFCTTGKASFSDFATSIVADMARIMFQQGVTEPLSGMATSFFGDMFSASAQGNVFDSAGVQAFAQGGTFTNKVVNRPTMFAHGGGFGIMGEAGPEGILPLTRMPSGNLGVESSKDQSSLAIEVNVINNTGEQTEASTTQRFDGEKWVIGVVLDAISRNKSGFRNSMKGAING